MNKVKDGGPAFPQNYITPSAPWPDSAPITVTQGGMTIRDYFAAKAMLAAAINPVGAEGFGFEERAAWAYQQADAMLKAREL